MKKPSLKFPAVFLFSFYTLYAAVLVPFYQIVAADIVLMNTLLFDFADLLLHWGEIFGLALVFAILLAYAPQFSLKELRPLFFLAGGALLYKYVGSIAAISVVYGSLNMTNDYLGYVVSFCLEIGLSALALWLLLRQMKKENSMPPFPIRGHFKLQNPLLFSAFYGMIGTLAFHLISFIMADVSYFLMGADYSIKDVPVMLLYWILLIILPCFLAFLLIPAVSSFFHQKAEKPTA